MSYGHELHPASTSLPMLPLPLVMTSGLFKLLWEVGARALLGVLLVVKVPTTALGSSTQLVLTYGVLNSGWKIPSKADRAQVGAEPTV